MILTVVAILMFGRQDQQSYQQRQATATSNTLDVSSLANSGQYGSQRYGTLDTGAASRFPTSATGRTGPYGGSQYNVQQQLAQANGSGPTYPTLDSAVTEEDLSSAMRGMAVEDEYSFSQQGATNRASVNNTHLTNPSGHQQALQAIPTAQQLVLPSQPSLNPIILPIILMLTRTMRTARHPILISMQSLLP